jgi:cell division protein ZapA
MSAKKNVVKVTIVGEEYTLRSEATPEHALAVAAYVDQSIRKILGGGNLVESHKAAILAALQITDELFKAREQSADLAATTRRLTADVRRWLPPAKRGGPV